MTILIKDVTTLRPDAMYYSILSSYCPVVPKKSNDLQNKALLQSPSFCWTLVCLQCIAVLCSMFHSFRELVTREFKLFCSLSPLAAAASLGLVGLQVIGSCSKVSFTAAAIFLPFSAVTHWLQLCS